MRAAILQRPRLFELREITTPEPNPEQMRIRVRGCGVCASSLPLWEGREWFGYPLPVGEPGHEAWGVVDAVGARVRGIEPGTAVATIASGGFAEYLLAEAESIIILPSSLDGYDFPGEVLGCILNIFSRSMISAGTSVAIVGSGFLGAALTQLCARSGAKVLAICRGEYSLALSRLCGAQCAVRMDSVEAIMDRARELVGANLFERVIETAGVQETLTLASELTGEGGRLIIAGYHQDGPRHVNMRLWNWRGIDVINAHERKPEVRVEGIRRAIDAVLSERLRLELLGIRRFTLDRINEAFAAIAGSHSEFAKAVVRI